MKEATISDLLLLIQVVFIIMQTVLIVWVSQEWRNQKRSERYADQCYNILKHWQEIKHYLYVLTGLAVYCSKDDKEYSVRFIEENENSIRIFWTFLRDPEIYIDRKDKNSMELIAKIEDDCRFMKSIFEDAKDSGTNICIEIEEQLLNRNYCLNSKQEVEKIKRNNDKVGVKKDEIFQIYEKDVEAIMKELKGILLEYAHYKK